MTVTRESLAKRVDALEVRVSDIENAHGESIYRIEREVIGTRIDIRTILTHMGLPTATDEQIDAELDQR